MVHRLGFAPPSSSSLVISSASSGLGFTIALCSAAGPVRQPPLRPAPRARHSAVRTKLFVVDDVGVGAVAQQQAHELDVARARGQLRHH
jgi:hypothetical protein